MTAADPATGGESTRSCAVELACHRCGVKFALGEREAFCPECGKCLDVTYDYEQARLRLSELAFEQRPMNIWRIAELMPIRDASVPARVGQFSGMSPMIPAERLGKELGLKNLYVKDDSTSRPTLSYKDRVVGMAIARLLELGDTEVGCVSTGNVGTAVASLAAKAGVTPYVFYPNRLELTKAKAVRALGARVCQVSGNYDEANRECRKVAEASGLEFANITLRPFYAEGAKTMAFDIVEQLGWRAPDNIVSATAGGTLSSRLHKGLVELEKVGLAKTAQSKMHIAQPAGCSPIASAIDAKDEEIHPCRPETIAHSLAIGTPGDGYLVIDAVLSRGGSAGQASDEEIFAGVDLLARTEGILTEPAGGTTIAVLRQLVQRGEIDPDATVVAIITGNGLKTLEDHPEKGWPQADCDAEAMLSVLRDFQSEGAAVPA
ncbi:MAG TPA: threonine synthase [Solirubrobacteraceae bacterium]|nr:threonine synthase [Solirubrobacteraceae bacterium]